MLTGVSPHKAPAEDADWSDFEDVRVGEPGTCWVCGREFRYSVTDFDADGPHAVCASKARRMDAAFQAQRQRNLPGAFNAWTIQW